jgi:hypothetical protein
MTCNRIQHEGSLLIAGQEKKQWQPTVVIMMNRPHSRAMPDGLQLGRRLAPRDFMRKTL